MIDIQAWKKCGECGLASPYLVDRGNGPECDDVEVCEITRGIDNSYAWTRNLQHGFGPSGRQDVFQDWRDVGFAECIKRLREYCDRHCEFKYGHNIVGLGIDAAIALEDVTGIRLTSKNGYWYCELRKNRDVIRLAAYGILGDEAFRWVPDVPNQWKNEWRKSTEESLGITSIEALRQHLGTNRSSRAEIRMNMV